MRRLVVLAALAALLIAPACRAWTWPASGDVLRPYSFDPGHPYAAGEHRGIDVAGERGADVLAPAAGRVTFAGTVPGSGLSVTVTTGDGYAVTLGQGATVAEGSVVGTIGPSGDAEEQAPYVHLGIRVAAEEQGYVDPLSLLPARAAPAPPVAVSAAQPAAQPPPVSAPAPAPAAAAAVSP